MFPNSVISITRPWFSAAICRLQSQLRDKVLRSLKNFGNNWNASSVRDTHIGSRNWARRDEKFSLAIFIPNANAISCSHWQARKHLKPSLRTSQKAMEGAAQYD